MIISNIQNRLMHFNKNYLASVVGETGSGKSWLGLQLCKKICPSFDASMIAFTPEDFFEILSRKPAKGSAILFEEVGVAVDSRTWYSRANRAINYVMQTFRRDNLAVIMTTPTLKFIDKNTQRLFHAYIETLYIDFKRKVCVTKFMNIQYNPRSDKFYYKYHRKKGNVKITKVAFSKPPQDLIKAYEAKKKEYVDTIISEQQEVLIDEKRKEAQRREEFDPDAIVEKVIKNYTRYLNVYKGREYLDTFMISADHKLSMDRAKSIKKLAEARLKEEKGLFNVKKKEA